MPIYQTARFQVRSEALEKCKAAIVQFVEAIKANEPGTRLYTAMQETQAETNFLHYFIFEDEAARDFHRTTDWVKRFTDILYPETMSGVEFEFYTLVASTNE